jgi:hypothetical protein
VVVVMLTMMVGVTHGPLEVLVVSVMVVRRVSTWGGPVRVRSTKPEGTLLHGLFDFIGAVLEPGDTPVLVQLETPRPAVLEIPGDDFVSDHRELRLDGDGPVQLEVDDVGGRRKPRSHTLETSNRLDGATLVDPEAETLDLDVRVRRRFDTSTRPRTSGVEGSDPILDGGLRAARPHISGNITFRIRAQPVSIASSTFFFAARSAGRQVASGRPRRRSVDDHEVSLYSGCDGLRRGLDGDAGEDTSSTVVPRSGDGRDDARSLAASGGST